MELTKADVVSNIKPLSRHFFWTRAPMFFGKACKLFDFGITCLPPLNSHPIIKPNPRTDMYCYMWVSAI